MSKKTWRSPVSDLEANRRAGGRKRYNHHRQAIARQRQDEMLKRFGFKALLLGRGTKRFAAMLFNVSEATIYRDVGAIVQREREQYEALLAKIEKRFSEER